MKVEYISENQSEWVQEHIRQYIQTKGAEGHLKNTGGPELTPTLLLQTTGRNSKLPRISPLIYGKTDTGYIVIASAGGAEKHPAWYLNLSTNSEVAIQVIADQFQAKARTVSGAERDTLWQQMVEIFPTYQKYQEQTERQIPVVLIEPI